MRSKRRAGWISPRAAHRRCPVAAGAAVDPQSLLAGQQRDDVTPATTGQRGGACRAQRAADDRSPCSPGPRFPHHIAAGAGAASCARADPARSRAGRPAGSRAAARSGPDAGARSPASRLGDAGRDLSEDRQEPRDLRRQGRVVPLRRARPAVGRLAAELDARRRRGRRLHAEPVPAPRPLHRRRGAPAERDRLPHVRRAAPRRRDRRRHRRGADGDQTFHRAGRRRPGHRRPVGRGQGRRRRLHRHRRPDVRAVLPNPCSPRARPR